MRTFFWTFSCGYTDAFSIIYRAHGTERHRNSLFIIPLDITVEHADELLYRNILPGPVIKHFILEAPEESFACRIVWRAPLLRHRPCQTRIFHPRDPAWPAIMASPIRVDNGMLVSLKMQYGLVQHRIDQFCIRTGANGPADYHAIKAVDDRRKIHLACGYMEFC